MEWRSLGMFISPLDVENVLSRVRELVRDSIAPVSLMFDVDLVTRLLRAVYSDKEDVVACVRAVH